MCLCVCVAHAGFKATGALVQSVFNTASEVVWFIVLLVLIFLGFGNAFFTLFRVDAATLAAEGKQ